MLYFVAEFPLTTKKVEWVLCLKELPTLTTITFQWRVLAFLQNLLPFHEENAALHYVWMPHFHISVNHDCFVRSGPPAQKIHTPNHNFYVCFIGLLNLSWFHPCKCSHIWQPPLMTDYKMGVKFRFARQAGSQLYPMYIRCGENRFYRDPSSHLTPVSQFQTRKATIPKTEPHNHQTAI